LETGPTFPRIERKTYAKYPTVSVIPMVHQISATRRPYGEVAEFATVRLWVGLMVDRNQ
jgi:hypothetical protein